MNTTNKAFKSQVQDHIINGLSDDLQGNTQDQLQAVVESFHNWYGPDEQKLIPSRQKAFTHWLGGLPSELNVEYTNYGIYNTLKTWYETAGMPYKEKESNKEAELYFNLFYREFNTLTKKNGVKF